MLFSLLQTAAGAGAADALEAAANADAIGAIAAEPEVVNFSLIALAAKGGWLMLVLLALSILAIYIFGKKWWMIRKAGTLDRNFMNNINDMVRDGKVKSAVSLCERYDSPIARMAEKGLERMGRSAQDIQSSMENIGNIEISKLEKGLPMLATIAGGAPMIGFLGTVMGMIQAFFNMANAGNNIDITMLSGGIYTAMVTTVGGLIVGILAYFGYNFLTSRISDLMSLMEMNTVKLLDILDGAATQPEETKQ